VTLERIENHFHAGLVALAVPFWGRPRVAAVLQSLLNQVTALEAAAWDVLEARTIDNADATRLAVLGKIVGQFNAGWPLETYRAVIRGKIRANRSRGLTDDLIEVVRLVTLTTGFVRVYHFVPATCWVVLEQAGLVFAIDAIRFLLPKTRAAGVKLQFFWAASPSAQVWGTGFWGDGPGWSVEVL
jgi:hypothetical protein